MFDTAHVSKWLSWSPPHENPLDPSEEATDKTDGTGLQPVCPVPNSIDSALDLTKAPRISNRVACKRDALAGSNEEQETQEPVYDPIRTAALREIAGLLAVGFAHFASARRMPADQHNQISAELANSSAQSVHGGGS